MKYTFNKKYLVIPAFAAVSLFAGGTALAYNGAGAGGFGNMWKNDPVAFGTQWESKITSEASILGITPDEMKTNWAAGKGVREIAKEKGISDADLQKKFQAARVAQHKEMLQTLVTQGKITQAQADARLKFMQENAAKAPQHMNGKMGMGGRGHMGGGMGLRQ